MKKFLIILLLLNFTNYYKKYESISAIVNNEIIIDKINLKEKIKSYEESNVDNNIIFLKETDIEKDFYVLAAHSGNSKISYFKNIYKLRKGDEINLILNDKKMFFNVDEIYYVNKTGKIILPVDSKEILYLTTCDKFNEKRQLIIKCVKKM